MATEPSTTSTLAPSAAVAAATAETVERELAFEGKNKVEAGAVEVHVGHNLRIDAAPVVNPDGSVTYTRRTDSSFEVGGETKIGDKIGKVEGNIAIGTDLQYQVTVPATGVGAIDLRAMSLERMTAPEVPVGTVMSLDVAAYGSAELAGAYQKLAAEVNIRDQSGVGMAVEKTGEHRVRVTIGPREALEIYAGAGLDIGGKAKLLLGLGYEAENSKFKSAEFDLSTPEGRKAYEQFSRDGAVPDRNSPDGQSVTGARTVETRENALDLSLKFEAEIKAERPRADGSTDEYAIKSEQQWSLARNGSADVVTTYADGRKETVGTRTLTGMLVPDSSTTITQVVEAPPKEGRHETLVSQSGDYVWLRVEGRYAKDDSGESLRSETHSGTTVEVAKKFVAGGAEDTAARRYTITLPVDDAAALNTAFGKQGQPSTAAEDGKSVVITLTEAEAAQWQKMARDAASAMTTRELQDYRAITSAFRDPNQTTEQFIAELTSGSDGHPRNTVASLAKIAEMAGSTPRIDKYGIQREAPRGHTQLPGTLDAERVQDRAAQAPAAPVAEAAPTAAAARTAVDRSHPDNALLQKTDAGVRELDRSIGKPWDGDSERLSASAFRLAVAMNCKPGDEIAVGLNLQSSRYAAGELLMVSRHGPGASPDPSANHASMPLAEALAKPAEQRLQEADAIRQGQAGETQRQQEQQARDQEVRAARTPVAP